LKELAIAVPCLNEAENLRHLLPQINAVIRAMKVDAEVFVVDGGSSDDTAVVAEELGAKVIAQEGAGYGGALKTAFAQIECPYIVTLDADYSHHPFLIKYLYEARHDAEIIIASRRIQGGYASMPMSRRVLSGILNNVFSRVLSLGIRDMSSGYRLYNRKAVMALDLHYNTYAVLQEILVRSYCNGYKIKELPMHYSPRRHGKTHARLLRFGWDYLNALSTMWSLRNSIESADYDYRAFDSRIPLQRYWQRKRHHVILRYIEDRASVLDAGCGSTQIMVGAPQIVGMDILKRKLRFMRQPGRSLVNASTFALPFKSESFECVISSQVIEHIPKDDVIFDELLRCLKPGGILILGTPDYGGWQWPLIEKAYGFFKPTGYADEHISHYTRQELFDLLEKRGVKVEDHDYILKGELIIKGRKLASGVPAAAHEENLEAATELRPSSGPDQGCAAAMGR